MNRIPSPFQILKSSRGAALLVAGLVIFVVILTFGTALTIQMQTLASSLNRTHGRTAALQAMQDFGVMMEKANDLYVEYGSCAATVPATTPWPLATDHFCFKAPIAGNCVTAPLGSGTAQWCLSTLPAGSAIGATGSTTAQLDLPPPTWREEVAIYSKAAVGAFKEIALGEFSGISEAVVSPSPWSPNLGAAPLPPNVQMNEKCAAGGAADHDYCQVCANTGTYVKDVQECITLQVCPLATPPGCAAGDFYTQKIAILVR